MSWPNALAAGGSKRICCLSQQHEAHGRHTWSEVDTLKEQSSTINIRGDVMAEKKARPLYVERKHNVLIGKTKVTRYMVKDPETGRIAKGTKGYAGDPSTYYESWDEAQKVADQLNRKYKRT